MPAYNTPPYSRSIYPQQNAIAVGYGIIPGGPSGTNGADQAETIATAYKSIPIMVAGAIGSHGFTQRTITWQVNYGTAPSAITLNLQGSINDSDAEYATIDTSTSTTGETGRSVASNFRFFRIYASSVTGTTTAIVKITCM